MRCDGPACRLRAGDCGLGARDGEATGCLGRCDVPVAAEEAGRALTIVARWRLEPYQAPALPAQPGAPVILRDAGFRDQADFAAARRRGAYGALAKLEVARAAELAASVGERAPACAGDFAARVLCERDPHLVLEGLAIVARGRGTPLRVPALLADAAAAAREHLGAFDVHPGAFDVDPGAFDVHPGAFDAGDGAELVQAARVARSAGLGGAHDTILCAVSGDVLRPGLYELLAGATVAEAIAAAGGVVAGLLVAPPSPAHDLAAPAPRALVVTHAGRAQLC